MQVVLIGLAAWMAWEAVRAAWPRRIWPLVQLVVVAGICYGLTYVDDRIVTALAAAAVVAGIRQLMLRAEVPDAVALPRARQPRRVTGRIPDLP